MEPFCKLKTMLKKANVIPLVSWPACKEMISKKSFFSRIKNMHFNDIESDALARLRPFLKHKHMNPQFVSTRCHHASKLAQWAHKFFIYCLHSKSLSRKGEKVMSLWRHGKVIMQEAKRRKRLWQRCEDGWLEGLWQY